MAAPAAGYKTGLQIAIMGKTGRQSGRLADYNPGGMELLQEGDTSVPVFLFSHHQQKAQRRAFPGGQCVGNGQPGLQHGGTAALHVSAPQPPDDGALVTGAKFIQIPGRNRIHMPHQIQFRLTRSHRDTQVVAFVLDRQAFHAKSRTAENLLQIQLNVLLLAGGGINIQHFQQSPAHPVQVNCLPNLFLVAIHGFFALFLLPLRVRLRDM